MARVVLYERRSTNAELQADSLDIQDEQLRANARAFNDEVVRVYPDDCSGRTADRKGFRRLIEDVSHGPDFEIILVLDVTRWGRFENVDESAYWEFFCVLHGVRIRYVNESFRTNDDPYDALQKTMKRAIASQFSRDKSRTVQYAKARVVRNGFYPGGSAPYGMTRLMVSPDGRIIQELLPGQHKAIGNYRIKLAPGPSDEVTVVRRIYRLFLDGMKRRAIARELDRSGSVPPSRGTDHWCYGEVHKILRNPVYAGMAKVSCKPSQNFPNGETILTPDAWKAIVSCSDWEEVQRRLNRSLWLRTPGGLAEQLKRAFELCGALDRTKRKALRLPMWETYLRHFTGGTQEALCLAYASKIGHATDRILAILRKHFKVERSNGVLVLNGLLRLKIVASFPRMIRRGLYWEFRFDPAEAQDVTIGLGYSPPPAVSIMQTFLFHNARFLEKRTIHPNLAGRSEDGNFRRSLTQIVDALSRNFYRDARAVKVTFLEKLRTVALANTRELARELGWPENLGYVVYRSLQRDGHVLPPLKHGRKGLVTVTCAGCQTQRTMPFYTALHLKTEFCQECWQAQRGGAVDVVCPSCGATRRYWLSDLARLSNGTDTPCARCVTGAPANARAQRLANVARRRVAMRAIAQYVRDALAFRYADVRISVKKGLLAPRISWTDRRKPRRQVLRLKCSQAAALTLARRSPDDLRDLAVRLCARKCWRRTGDKRSDMWTVHVDARMKDTGAGP